MRGKKRIPQNQTPTTPKETIINLPALSEMKPLEMHKP